MPRAEVSGATIHYEVAGEGEPLLLVPCLAADNACWALQLPARAPALARAPRGSGPRTSGSSWPGSSPSWPSRSGRRRRPPPRPASEAEVALARMYSPVVRLKEQPGSCDIGRAVPAHGHRPADGERRGRPARPLGPDQHREGGPDGARTSRGGSSTTTSTSPATRCGRAAPTSSGRRGSRPPAPPTAYARVVTEAGVARASWRSSTGSSTSTTTGTTSTRATGR